MGTSPVSGEGGRNGRTEFNCDTGEMEDPQEALEFNDPAEQYPLRQREQAITISNWEAMCNKAASFTETIHRERLSQELPPVNLDGTPQHLQQCLFVTGLGPQYQQKVSDSSTCNQVSWQKINVKPELPKHLKSDTFIELNDMITFPKPLVHRPSAPWCFSIPPECCLLSQMHHLWSCPPWVSTKRPVWKAQPLMFWLWYDSFPGDLITQEENVSECEIYSSFCFWSEWQTTEQ